MTKTVSSRIISSSIAWLSASRTVYGCVSAVRVYRKHGTHHHGDTLVGAGSPLLGAAEQEGGRAPGDDGGGGGEEGIPGDELCAGGGGGEGGGGGAECAGEAACDPGSHCGFWGGWGEGEGEGERFVDLLSQSGPQRCSKTLRPARPVPSLSHLFPPLYSLFIPPPPRTFTSPRIDKQHTSTPHHAPYSSTHTPLRAPVPADRSERVCKQAARYRPRRGSGL